LAGAAGAEHAFEGRDLTLGETLYGDHCASCHGVDLEGQANWRSPNPDGTLPAPPHDETGHTWHHDSQYLFLYTQMGGQDALEAIGVTNFRSAMPAFGDVLSADEIWDVLAFIQSTWPERMQEIQAARTPGH
jgi:mono/diheme cytochrome c family protein